MSTAPAWYVRRAIPWPPIWGGLLLGALMVVATHRWESVTGGALPAVALLAAAGVAFVHDEPALAVTSVAPRGARWAATGRSVAALLPVAAGLALVTLAPGEVRAPEWALVIGGLSATALMVAGAASSRGIASPGAAVAGLVVLAGLVPLTVGPLLDLPAVYPSPGLTSEVTTFWTVVGASALFLALVGPRLARLRPPLAHRGR